MLPYREQGVTEQDNQCENEVWNHVLDNVASAEPNGISFVFPAATDDSIPKVLKLLLQLICQTCHNIDFSPICGQFVQFMLDFRSLLHLFLNRETQAIILRISGENTSCYILIRTSTDPSCSNILDVVQ